MNATSMLLACYDLCRPGGPEGMLLHDVTLEIRAAERHALVGKSGSGKSLLLRALAQLDFHARGRLMFLGRSAEAIAVPEFRRQVIYVTQHSTLLPTTVEDNLKIPFQLACRRAESYDRAAMIRRLELLGRDASFLEKPVSELSGGEARTVALLRVTQLQANVLLLDEPTSSLDPETTGAVERLIESWRQAQADRAYVWVTHSLPQARRVADQVWEMQRGRLQPWASHTPPSQEST